MLALLWDTGKRGDRGQLCHIEMGRRGSCAASSCCWGPGTNQDSCLIFPLWTCFAAKEVSSVMEVLQRYKSGVS